MAQRNEQVLDRVRQELNGQPDLGSRQLFEIAKEMEPSMEENSLAQFHARYVLPIKREHAQQRAEQEGASQTKRKPRKRAQRAEPEPQPAAKAARGRRGKRAAEQPSGQAQTAAAAAGPTAAPSSGEREQIRAVLMEFALEVAQAESRTDIVQVLRKVDDYVERVVTAR